MTGYTVAMVSCYPAKRRSYIAQRLPSLRMPRSRYWSWTHAQSNRNLDFRLPAFHFSKSVARSVTADWNSPGSRHVIAKNPTVEHAHFLPSKSFAFTRSCTWESVGFDPSMRIAYLSSLVDNVPFSFRSKHLKASRYSVTRTGIGTKTQLQQIDPSIKEKKAAIGSMPDNILPHNLHLQITCTYKRKVQIKITVR